MIRQKHAIVAKSYAVNVQVATNVLNARLEHSSMKESAIKHALMANMLTIKLRLARSAMITNTIMSV